MPNERLSMRRIREILRLKSLGLSGRAVARTLGLGSTTVSDYLGRAKVAGLDWEGTGKCTRRDDLAGLERSRTLPR